MLELNWADLSINNCSAITHDKNNVNLIIFVEVTFDRWPGSVRTWIVVCINQTINGNATT